MVLSPDPLHMWLPTHSRQLTLSVWGFSWPSKLSWPTSYTSTDPSSVPAHTQGPATAKLLQPARKERRWHRTGAKIICWSAHTHWAWSSQAGLHQTIAQPCVLASSQVRPACNVLLTTAQNRIIVCWIYVQARGSASTVLSLGTGA